MKCKNVGQDSAVGTTTHYGVDGPGIEYPWGEIFCTRSDWFWGAPSLLYNGYRVFPGVKRPGHGVDHTPHLASRLKKELNFTSAHPLGLRGVF